MPPKKKGKGKAGKKTKKDGEAEGVEEPLSLEQQNLFLKRQVESLKHRLIMSANLSSNAEASARELRNRLHLLHTDFQNEKQRTFELTADMTRQYKAMKVELLNSINALNDEILKYKDLLSKKEMSMQEMENKKDSIIAMKEAEITEWKQKMDEMAHEFSQMLKQTLDKMSERIIISNDEWDPDNEGSDNPTPSQLQRKFEGFSLGIN